MNDLINKINLRFESGNSVPVDSVRITREELDALIAERDAALEREQALAAHVEKYTEFVQYVRKRVKRKGEYAPLITQEMDELLASAPDIRSTVKRDLIKQAEALEEVMVLIGAGARPDEISDYLTTETNELRQRAQALK